ncbi:SnoaL-like domain protein [compost metagenome]
MPRHLQDQFEIQQLLYRYADAADRRDAEAYCGCFLDGQVILRGRYELRDGREVVRLLGEMFEWTMHGVHNHIHQVDGDRASGFTYCVASHVSREAGRRSRLDMYIRYEDEMRRSDRGWVFVSRTLNVGCEELVQLEG